VQLDVVIDRRDLSTTCVIQGSGQAGSA
jgi:hypothetical protein